ncbi:MAG: hypothetical protein WBG38_05060, partial [Nodosilinea sp.]
AAGERAQGEDLLERASKVAVEQTKGDCYSSATSPTESFLNRAAEYSEAGYLEVALQVASHIEDLFKPLMLAEVAEDYAKMGQQRKAKEVITEAIAAHKKFIAQNADAGSDSIPWSPDRIFTAMAFQLVESGQPELATFVLAQSELVSSQNEVTDPSSDATLDDISHALSVANLLAKLERSQEARSLVEAIAPKIELSKAYPTEVIYRWVDVAQLYNRLGERSKAVEMLEQAENLPETLSNSEIMATRALLAGGYAELGEFDRAKALADTIDHVPERQNAYRSIAVAYAKAGSVDTANSLVQSIGNPQFGRSSLIHAYLETEQYAEAEKIAQQPDMRESMLPQIGATYCSEGLPEQVVALIQPGSSEDWLRSCAATEFARQGEFQRALELAQTIENSENKANALVDIASQYTRPRTEHRLQGRLSDFWQHLFGITNSENAAEILDQARSLIES